MSGQQIEEKLDFLISQVAELRREVNELKTTCGRMDGHINFVEDTYTKVRVPFSWILNRIPFGGSDDPSRSLPALGAN